MENWKPIKDFPGYEISDQGNVRSYWKLSGTGNLKEGSISFVGHDSRSLKGEIGSHERSRGYKSFTLRRDRKPFKRCAHLLVLETFGPPKPGVGYLGDHIDRDLSNNSITNLRWATHGQNNMNIPKLPDRSSKYKGVRKTAPGKGRPWKSYFSLNKKNIHLGYFDSEVDAAMIHDIYSYKEYGDIGQLNFPEAML